MVYGFRSSFFGNCGLPDFRTSGLSDFQVSGLLASEFGTSGLPGFRSSRLPDFRKKSGTAAGPRDGRGYKSGGPVVEDPEVEVRNSGKSESLEVRKSGSPELHKSGGPGTAARKPGSP
jgi:hypothetical protein